MLTLSFTECSLLGQLIMHLSTIPHQFIQFLWTNIFIFKSLACWFCFVCGGSNGLRPSVLKGSSATGFISGWYCAHHPVISHLQWYSNSSHGYYAMVIKLIIWILCNNTQTQYMDIKHIIGQSLGRQVAWKNLGWCSFLLKYFYLVECTLR